MNVYTLYIYTSHIYALYIHIKLYIMYTYI